MMVSLMTLYLMRQIAARLLVSQVLSGGWGGVVVTNNFHIINLYQYFLSKKTSFLDSLLAGVVIIVLPPKPRLSCTRKHSKALLMTTTKAREWKYGIYPTYLKKHWATCLVLMIMSHDPWVHLCDLLSSRFSDFEKGKNLCKGNKNIYQGVRKSCCSAFVYKALQNFLFEIRYPFSPSRKLKYFIY